MVGSCLREACLEQPLEPTKARGVLLAFGEFMGKGKQFEEAGAGLDIGDVVPDLGGDR